MINRFSDKNYNVLPSVSAAIGFSFETAYFWLVCILIHTPFRFKIASQANKSYERSLQAAYGPDSFYKLEKKDSNEYDLLRRLACLAYLLNRSEIIGLIILSIFTSNGNYG